MGFLSNLWDAVKSLFGGRKESKKLPARVNYYPPGGYYGYMDDPTVYVYCKDGHYQLAAQIACQEWNKSAQRTKTRLRLALVPTPVYAGKTANWVIETNNDRVPKGQTGTTPPENMIGFSPEMPWARVQAKTFVRSGLGTAEAAELLVHEGGHALGLMHPKDTDGVDHEGDDQLVMNPKADQLHPQPADDLTLNMTYERRDSPLRDNRKGVHPEFIEW